MGSVGRELSNEKHIIKSQAGTAYRMASNEEATSRSEVDQSYKIVDRVFSLPLISELAGLSHPVQPYLKTSLKFISLTLDDLACTGFDKFVEVVPALQKYGVAHVFNVGVDTATDVTNMATDFLGKKVAVTVTPVTLLSTSSTLVHPSSSTGI